MYVFIQYKLQMFLASELMYLNGDKSWVLLEQRNIFINSMIDHSLDSSGSMPFVKQLEHEGKIKSPFYIHIFCLFPHLHSKPSFALSVLWKWNSLTYLCVDPRISMFMIKCIATSMYPYYSAKFRLSLVRLAIHLLGKCCQKR